MNEVKLIINLYYRRKLHLWDILIMENSRNVDPQPHDDEMNENDFLIYSSNLRQITSYVRRCIDSNEDGQAWPVELDDVLIEIAKTGKLRYPWYLLKFVCAGRLRRTYAGLRGKEQLSEHQQSTMEIINGKLCLFKKPPFSIQRLAELLLYGDKTYRFSNKWIFAVWRTLKGIQLPAVEELPRCLYDKFADDLRINVTDLEKVHIRLEPPLYTDDILCSWATKNTPRLPDSESCKLDKNTFGGSETSQKSPQGLADMRTSNEDEIEKSDERPLISFTNVRDEDRLYKKRRADDKDTGDACKNAKKLKSPNRETQEQIGQLSMKGSVAEFLEDVYGDDMDENDKEYSKR